MVTKLNINNTVSPRLKSRCSCLLAFKFVLVGSFKSLLLLRLEADEVSSDCLHSRIKSADDERYSR